MSNKELIVSLIYQDLKHSQLVSGLDQLGLEASNKHCLEILDIIANLMNVPEGHIEMYWGKKYVQLMAESVNFDIGGTGKRLRVYATSCYRELLEISKEGKM